MYEFESRIPHHLLRKNIMNVMIIDGSPAYQFLFRSLGHTIVNTLNEAQLMVFTGGADVSPHLYGDQAHRQTGNSPFRDAQEKAWFDRAIIRDIPMVGICRGGQFLNVMSGGRMYQHVEEHCGDHEIVDLLTGETVLVSSTHHQMMLPSEKGLLVASSALAGSREWFDGSIARKDVSQEDIEVVYYKHTNCLCFQPHPEFQSEHYVGMRNYFAKCLERFLDVQVEQAEEVA